MLLTSITVSGKDLISTISMLRTVMRGTYRPAVGIYSGLDCLKFRISKLDTVISGKGNFIGMAVLPFRILIDYVETVSPDDQIQFEHLPSAVRIGSIQLNCEWKDGDYQIPDWPYRATLGQIIGLKNRYEPEMLEYQEANKKISEARRRANELLSQAEEILAPIGFTADDLDLAMDEVINRSAADDEEEIIW